MTAPLRVNWDGTVINVDQQLDEIERVNCEESLYEFLRKGWKNIDPAPWKDGWPIEAVAEHLQAVVDGDIKRLVINLPPRLGKSSICSVALPAWCWAQPEKRWGPTSGPGVAFLHASYAQQLSLRDSVKCRRLISSPWYQKHWGKRFHLSGDQNAKMRFSNSEGGERLITSIGAAVTGEGGSVIVVDDPNAANEAFSEATIQSTTDWWDSTMSTRLNDPKTGAYIIIQQRLALDDLTGHILSKDRGEWTHLVLPMHFDPIRSFPTRIGWEDPRTIPGQLLWPERFDVEEVTQLERVMGPFTAAGQLEQLPSPKGGGIIKDEWWQTWIGDEYPLMDYVIAYLDTAYTTKEMNDPSALAIFGVFTDDAIAVANRSVVNGKVEYLPRTYAETAPKVMMMHAWTERLELHDLVKRVAETCKKYGVDLLRVENKAAGISVAQELKRLYGHENFMVDLHDPKAQDKVSRLYSVQHLFAEGMIHVPCVEDGDLAQPRVWAQKVIDQVSQFPNAKHDDLVDCVSGSLRSLRDMGLLVRGPEKLEEIEDMKRYDGRPPAALYDC